MDLPPWQRRVWTALYLGSLSFLGGQWLAGWTYRKLTGRKS